MSFFGAIIPDRYVHVSPLCPKIKTTVARDMAVVSDYGTEADAMADGHIKRCPVCFNMYSFELFYNNERRHFLLRQEEIDIIKFLHEIRPTRKRLDLQGISEYLNIEYYSANNITKKLRQLKIIKSDQPGYGSKNEGYKKLNIWGDMIIIALKNGAYLKQACVLDQAFCKPYDKLQ